MAFDKKCLNKISFVFENVDFLVGRDFVAKLVSKIQPLFGLN